MTLKDLDPIMEQWRAVADFANKHSQYFSFEKIRNKWVMNIDLDILQDPTELPDDAVSDTTGAE